MLSTLPPVLNSTPLPASDGAVARAAREAHTGFATLMQQQADLRAAVLRSIDGYAATARPSARATEAAPEPKRSSATSHAPTAQAHSTPSSTAPSSTAPSSTTQSSNTQSPAANGAPRDAAAAPSNQAAEPVPRSTQDDEPTAPAGADARPPARRPAKPSGTETGAAERSALPGGTAAAAQPITADPSATADGSATTPVERSNALALRNRLAARSLADTTAARPGPGVAAAAGLATPAHDSVDAETIDPTTTTTTTTATSGPDTAPVPAWLQGQALVTGWRPAPAAAQAPTGTAMPGTAVGAAARGGQGQGPHPTAEAAPLSTAVAAASAAATAAASAAATAAARPPEGAAAAPSPSQGLLPALAAAAQPSSRDVRAPMAPARQATPTAGTAEARTVAASATGAASAAGAAGAAATTAAASAASAAGAAGMARGPGPAATPPRSSPLAERTAVAAPDPRRAAPPADTPIAVVATATVPAAGTGQATGAMTGFDPGSVAPASAGTAVTDKDATGRVDSNINETLGGASATLSAAANTNVAAVTAESTSVQHRPAEAETVAAAIDPLLQPTASATASARAAAQNPLLAAAIASSGQAARAGIGAGSLGAASPRTVDDTERGAGRGPRLPQPAERTSTAEATAPAARATRQFSLRPEAEQITLPIAPDLPRATDAGSRPAAAGVAPAAGAGPVMSTTALAAQAAQTEARTSATTPASDAVRGAEPGASSMAAPMPVSGSAPASALVAGTSAGAPPAQVESRIAVPLDSPAFAPTLGAQISLFAREGVQTVRLQLNPAEMGPITVQIALDGHAARVDFQADLASTREVIQASLPALAGALQEAGMTLAGGGVSQQPSSHQPPPQFGQPGATHRADDRAAGTEPQPLPTLAPVRSRGLVDLVA